MIREIKLPVALILVLALVSPVFAGTAEQDVQREQIRNIMTFARLFGYVRYFYPGDEAVLANWQRFAVYGVKRVENAKSTAELKKILEELFLPYAPALVIHKSAEKVSFSLKSITPPYTSGTRVISWQHLGVGVGDPYGIYKSVRLNRKPFELPANSFCTITNFIPAAPYRGKQIKMKAAVKVDEGQGQLWLRVDRPRRQLGFFDNMDERPVRPGDWQDYEITGRVANDAERIYYGGFLIRQGRIWLDNFRIYVKDKRAGQWRPLLLTNPGFEKDEQDKRPAKWGGSRQDNYAIAVTSSTAAQGKNSVEIKWTAGDMPIVEPLFDARATIGEHISKKIGSGLSCIMPLALYGTDTYTYPRAPKKIKTALGLAIREGTPAKLLPKNRYVRLGSIVITWNVFQHFFPYFDVVKTDWKKELPKALAHAYNDKTQKDFLETLRRFTATLKDGHVRVQRMKDKSDFFYPAVSLDIVEDQLIVTDVFDKSIKTLKPGDIVTALNGLTAKEAIKREKQFISAATENWMRFRLSKELISGNKNSDLILETFHDGVKRETVLKRSFDFREYYGLSSRFEKFKKIEKGIYYMDLDKIRMNEIQMKMPELEKAKAIICDLRGYPRSNHGFISHLLKQDDTSGAWLKVPRIIYPDYQKVSYRESGWKLKKAAPHLTAKMIFIVNGMSISYAESFLSLIEHYKLATIIGESTGGTNGNVNSIMLPGAYRITWTGSRVVKHDGSRHHGVGIIPHIRLKRTIDAIKQGRDEFLEAAIKLAKK
jgi:C-terminal processing protease CtpA/Prc